MTVTSELRVEQHDGGWVLAGPAGQPEDLRLCNDYLGYLADRHYAPGTRRSYAFDLLAFARWLTEHDVRLESVDTDALLRFLACCRSDGLAPATTNRRLAAIKGCSRSGRCGTRLRPTQCRKARPPGEPPDRSSKGCWGTWPVRNPGRRCGCGSHDDCPADSIASR